MVFLSTTLAAALFFIIKAMKLQITDTNELRGSDPQGSGAFGASRGSRKHKGLDLLAEAGQIIKAPFDLKIVKHGIVYNSTSQFKYVEFEGLGLLSVFRIRLMYVQSDISVGQKVAKGSNLGICQNIAAYHGGGMKNHLHLEIRVLNILVNPELFV